LLTNTNFQWRAASKSYSSSRTEDGQGVDGCTLMFFLPKFHFNNCAFIFYQEMSAAMVNAGKMIIEQADLELLQEVGKMFGYCRDVLDDPEVLRILLKKGLQIFEDRESGIRGIYIYFYFSCAFLIKRDVFIAEVSPSTRTFCLLRAECMRKGCVNLMEFLHACTHGLCLQCHMETSKERSCVVAGCNNFSSISIDVSG